MSARRNHLPALWIFLTLLLVTSCSSSSDPITDSQAPPLMHTARPQPAEEEMLAESVAESEVPASPTTGQLEDSILSEATSISETSIFSVASTWGQRAPLPEPNSEIAVAQLNGKIFVVGGYPASRNTVASVQVYDAASDSWALAAPVPVPQR